MVTKEQILEAIPIGLHKHTLFPEDFAEKQIMYYNDGYTFDSVVGKFDELGILHNEPVLELYNKYPFEVKFI